MMFSYRKAYLKYTLQLTVHHMLLICMLLKKKLNKQRKRFKQYIMFNKSFIHVNRYGKILLKVRKKKLKKSLKLWRTQLLIE